LNGSKKTFAPDESGADKPDGIAATVEISDGATAAPSIVFIKVRRSGSSLM
jgi:hypothetical protein